MLMIDAVSSRAFRRKRRTGFHRRSSSRCGRSVGNTRELRVRGNEVAVADRRATTRQRSKAEARGDTAGAAALRAEAQALLDEAHPVAVSYEQLRESLAAGPERTAELERQVGKARAAARQGGTNPQRYCVCSKPGTDGERIYALALMLEDERLRDFAASMDAIERSRSAFEQSQTSCRN